MQTVAILTGGKSAEHEISLISAYNIIKALDRERWTPMLIGVDRNGKWWLQDETRFLEQDPDPKTIALKDRDTPLAIVPGDESPAIFNLATGKPMPDPDVVFGILHGPYGEDGSMQGLLVQLGLPYVGPDVLGSSAAMDKDIAKRLLTEAGIENSPFRTFKQIERDQIDFDNLKSELKLPLFVKPARMGSSVGVSKVTNASELQEAVDLAFRFDRKILIEEGIVGREIECAVLGNDHVRASVIGEVIPPDGFYDYESKYISADGAKLLLPAPNLSESEVQRIQAEAIRTFKVLGCEGLSRVDFFYTPDQRLVVNEVNTLPGFTKISMYPSLWKLSGLSYQDLITELLELAIQRRKAEAALETKR